jgi:hypothetical protein
MAMTHQISTLALLRLRSPASAGDRDIVVVVRQQGSAAHVVTPTFF